MKHLYSLSLLLLAFLLSATATAHDFEVDGIYYNINGNEATVTYKGTYSHQNTDRYSGFVTIPAAVTYNGATYSVTSIGEWAFDNCTGLTNIYIPNSVTSIGKGAFYLCSGLTSVTIPDSVTTIGTATFYECTSLSSVTIPNSIISIGNHAFTGCSGLTNVLIPNSVTTIGSWAFSGCSGLTSIDIPNTVTSIGSSAFYQCSGLANIVVANDNPIFDSRNNCNAIIETATSTLVIGCKNTVILNSITSIGNDAFTGCSGLTNVIIPNSVTHIGDRAFLSCSFTSIDIPNSVVSIGDDAFKWNPNLTSVTIPNSVTTIGINPFSGCIRLANITVDTGNLCYDSRNNCNAIIETATNALITGCMNSVIPNSVTSIGDYAFSRCSGLTNIDIPNSVTSIGHSAFERCSGLTNIDIPNSVTSIGAYAFTNSNGLTSIKLPNSVITIGNYAVSYCSSLAEIYCLALTPPTIESGTFLNCYELSLYVPFIAVDKYKAADYWNNFTNIVGMPYTFEVDGTSYHATTMNTATVIAHNDEATLYSGDVVIPDSVTYEGYTFAVTGIENNAFEDCYDLTSVVIPNSVTHIGEQAFQGCTALTSVTIGSGVTTIGAKAFNYCNALATVKCIGMMPPVMASTDCFSTAAYNRATLFVPRQFVDAYQAADYWYKFAHIDGWGSAGRGDIDGDGAVNIRDVTTLIDAILTGEHEGVYFESADVNINGRLDIGDVTTIIDMLLNDIE